MALRCPACGMTAIRASRKALSIASCSSRGDIWSSAPQRMSAGNSISLKVATESGRAAMARWYQATLTGSTASIQLATTSTTAGRLDLVVSPTIIGRSPPRSIPLQLAGFVSMAVAISNRLATACSLSAPALVSHSTMPATISG